MADGILAGAGAIEKASKVIGTARGDLRTEINNLKGNMEQVKAHWHGQGAATFQTVSEAWKVQTQDIIDVLDIFEQNLTTSQRQYDADDASSAASLAKYNSVLGG